MGLFGSLKESNFTEVKIDNDYTISNIEEFETTLRALNIYLSDKQVHHERIGFTFVDMIS